MTTKRRIASGIIALLAAASLAYLYDPPWIGGMTSGLRRWEEDPPGTRFRWTMGRGTFYVPSHVSTMTVPLRAFFPGPDGSPVQVELRDDGRLISIVELTDPDAWVRHPLPLKPYTGHRRFRRIDLRVSRVVPPFNLGVMTGEFIVR
jgi:hypothetical protein